MKMPQKTELLTVQEMYEADRLCDQHVKPARKLMEAAGTLLFREIVKRWSPRKTVILCGPGNNGGDGFVLANLLASRGWFVKILMLGSVEKLPKDAQYFAKKWRYGVDPCSEENLSGARLVVDALFGAGLSRPIDGSALGVIKKVQSMNVPVVAVDIPSGIDGNSGAILGMALHSKLCVTFARAKPGHFLYPGAGYIDRLVIGDIGIPDQIISQIGPKISLNLPNVWKSAIPQTHSNSHKYSRGHGVIVAGTDMTGASILASQAARRCGAGLITLASQKSSYDLYRCGPPGALVSSEDLPEILKDGRKSAILIGPGLGLDETARQRLDFILQDKRPVVLDADALTLLSKTYGNKVSFSDRDVIMTPHEGEFQRLFGDMPGSKLEKALRAAKSSRCVIIYKGPDTVIAGPDGRALINTSAPSTLATAGSGDVLAGLALGFLSQGLDPFHAAAISVYVHTACARRLDKGLIAEDLVTILPTVLSEMTKE